VFPHNRRFKLIDFSGNEQTARFYLERLGLCIPTFNWLKFIGLDFSEMKLLSVRWVIFESIFR
jgi:hypothetical protein